MGEHRGQTVKNGDIRQRDVYMSRKWLRWVLAVPLRHVSLALLSLIQVPLLRPALASLVHTGHVFVECPSLLDMTFLGQQLLSETCCLLSWSFGFLC